MYTLNGYPIRDLRLVLPPKGLSVARVEYLSDEVVEGAATVANSDGDKCKLDVVQAGVFVWTGQALLRSANALAATLPAAHFRGATIDSAANDALAAAGVTRDRTVRGSTATLNYWTRPESTGASVTDSFIEPVVGLGSLPVPPLPPPQAASRAAASATVSACLQNGVNLGRRSRGKVRRRLTPGDLSAW